MRIEVSDFKYTDTYQVHWIDMDIAKHVNNLVYMKWAETLRMNFFDEINIDSSFVKGTIGPILGAQYCKYIFPMRYPDNAITGKKEIRVLGHSRDPQVTIEQKDPLPLQVNGLIAELVL